MSGRHARLEAQLDQLEQRRLVLCRRISTLDPEHDKTRLDELWEDECLPLLWELEDCRRAIRRAKSAHDG